MTDITRLLHEIDDGDSQASAELLPLVYQELKQLAAARMAAERADHTLQATALVHEAYLRLVGSNDQEGWDSRGHFFGAAAEAMRRILVDHARAKKRLKRGGDGNRVAMDDIDFVWNSKFGDILELHEALDKLEQQDAQAAELVKLRCFAGQSLGDSAALMGISRSTATRLWTFARAWLYDALSD